MIADAMYCILQYDSTKKPLKTGEIHTALSLVMSLEGGCDYE